MKYYAFIVFLVSISTLGWTQTPTPTPTNTTTASPVSILFPSSNPSDFSQNQSEYQLWNFNVNTGWAQVPYTSKTSGVTGLAAPVTTFNGQFAIIKNSIPTSTGCTNFNPNVFICKSSSATLSISGSSQNVQFLISDYVTGTPYLSWGHNFPPGKYVITLNNLPLAADQLIIKVTINGNTAVNEVVDAGC